MGAAPADRGDGPPPGALRVRGLADGRGIGQRDSDRQVIGKLGRIESGAVQPRCGTSQHAWDCRHPGRELVTEAPVVKPASYKAAQPNKAIRALRDDVFAQLGKAGAVLIDVRSPKEFSGELLAPENLPQEGAQRGGHIPGAANIPWAQAVREDGTFKPADELKALYQGKGVTPDKAVIAYCRIGERSSHTWFVLTYLLGYPNVRNYDGSWTEWGSLIAAPIER